MIIPTQCLLIKKEKKNRKEVLDIFNHHYTYLSEAIIMVCKTLFFSGEISQNYNQIL